MSRRTTIEPFKIKVIEPIIMTTHAQRVKFLKKANNNPFLLKSDEVLIDLLTDSGTAAMSTGQWSAMMLGDESYAGARSWLHLESVVRKLTTHPHVLPTHQGRAAERILYGYLGGKKKVFISNTHFDTTRANIEFTGAKAIDCALDIGSHPSEFHPFKGNMDLEKLEKTIQKHRKENIGAVILTVTNNTGGGQPVSMENAKRVRDICKKYGLLFILDACRIAENAYFIKHREKKYRNKSYREIAVEMFSLSDGSIMSAKKDGIVNMGGFLSLKDQKIVDACINLLIITEGFSTYGGLTGRDMEAMAVGLQEVFRPAYLNYRIKSTQYLGTKLQEIGIPIMLPVGGHAVYVDAKALYSHIPVEEYPGQSLACELYLRGGIRCAEIGSVMFGKYDPKGKLVPASMELVRLAIPRRVYTQSHIDYVIEVFEEIYLYRKTAKGVKITYEPKFLRHFTAHFEILK